MGKSPRERQWRWLRPPAPESPPADHEKQCRACGEVKPRTEFWKHASGKDGLEARCRACKTAYYKGYAASERGKARHLRAQTRYLLSKPKEAHSFARKRRALAKKLKAKMDKERADRDNKGST